jgi:hypothetical protein
MNSIKLHYFDQEQADKEDWQLGAAKAQGYVPKTCLLGGMTVMHEVNAGHDPCAGCAGPRAKCRGRGHRQWQ